MDEPFLLMIAGPNGSGKTTLVQHLLRKGIDLGEYINPDDISAELEGAADERTRRAQAIADQRRDACIKTRRSFSFETVMSHPSKIEVLVRAKEAGYRVLLYFIGTDDPQTNVERVALRVAQGGHDVPKEKIRDRWLRTMTLLQQAIRSSDQSYIFDNSIVGTIDAVPRLVFRRDASRAGHLPQSEMIGRPPLWVQRFVLGPLGTDFFESYANVQYKTAVGSIVTLPVQAKASGAPSSPPDVGLSQISKALIGAVDAAARAFARPGAGLSTGFRDLDRKIAGLQRAELIVIASRHGLGKTALATNIAYNIAKSWRTATHDGKTSRAEEGGIVGFFSLEMSAEQIASRVISQQSGIPVDTIRRGAITEKQFELIRDLSIEFQNLPFYIDDAAVLSAEQLVSRAHRLKEQRGLDLLVVDNLDLLRSAARTNFGETKAGSFEITRRLKGLAKSLNIPVLILAQLPSRVSARKDKRPRLDEFDDNGAVERDADVIMFLHRDDYYLFQEEPAPGSYEHMNWINQVDLAYGKAELIIAKQRNGPTGVIEFAFNPGNGCFQDLM
ncbi:DnaB-like helicase C-terminal domain-containing protein [Bradyrhizobium sp. USDA 10063]